MTGTSNIDVMIGFLGADTIHGLVGDDAIQGMKDPTNFMVMLAMIYFKVA